MEEQMNNDEGSRPPHLKEGLPGIKVRVWTREEFKAELPELYSSLYQNNDKKVSPAQNLLEIKFLPDERTIRQEKFIVAKKTLAPYIISPIDKRNKFSRGMRNCIGTTVAGIEIGTGDKISFFMHATPSDALFAEAGREEFLADLSLQVRRIKDLSEPETVDVQSVGGYNLTEGNPLRLALQGKFDAFDVLLKQVVKDELGFVPEQPAAPKEHPGSDDGYYSNSERVLHVIRTTF